MREESIGLVSVVIPVYDAPEPGLLVQKLTDLFDSIARPFEIIFVDDGSPDQRTWTSLEQLARHHASVRAIQLTRNFGQQAATLCGLQAARGTVVITMDDDLQHDPADIPRLLAHEGRDIVIGTFASSRHKPLRRLASRVKHWFDRFIIGVPKGMHLSSFRMLSRTVVDAVLSMRTPHPFLPALMFHVSRDAVSVPVSHSTRVAGRSGYTARKLFSLFSNLVINNSSVLLRVAASAGLLSATLSFLLALLVVYQKVVYGISVQGWTSLIAAVLFTGGGLLVSVGILGEYLVRIIESSEARPTYLVRASTPEIRKTESIESRVPDLPRSALHKGEGERSSR